MNDVITTLLLKYRVNLEIFSYKVLRKTVNRWQLALMFDQLSGCHT